MTQACTTLLALLGLFTLTMFAVSPAGAAEKPLVVLETSQGPITIELDQEKAPITVKNFLEYVDSGFYADTVFHRVIGPNEGQPRGFMIQGGGFASGSPIQEKETRGMIKNEAGNGLANRRGTVVMARTPDPDSASAQFFINLDDNTFLDRARAADGFGYTVFGQVVEGMDVVDAIAKVPTGEARAMARGPGGQSRPTTFDDVPRTPVVIQAARRKQ
ncbi:peptidylprolyl isomerase PpiA [soil metagenome]